VFERALLIERKVRRKRLAAYAHRKGRLSDRHCARRSEWSPTPTRARPRGLHPAPRFRRAPLDRAGLPRASRAVFEISEAGGVAARPRQACDEARSDGIWDLRNCQAGPDVVIWDRRVCGVHSARSSEMTRHFPPPWRAEKFSGGYVVRDANGFAVAYVYGRSTEVEAMEAKQMTMDEARRVASNIARLPEMLKWGE
jgi:hypothetical protein